LWRRAALGEETHGDGAHQVKLLPGKAVKGFVTGNKNDRHDARAIWTAVQQPHVKAVAIKTEEQQAILALHRMRSQLVKFRTAQINGLRGLLTEYGEVAYFAPS
jgi:transposase